MTNKELLKKVFTITHDVTYDEYLDLSSLVTEDNPISKQKFIFINKSIQALQSDQLQNIEIESFSHLAL